MKKYKRELLAMLLVLAGCMLWSSGAGRYAELDREYGGVSLRFETTPLNIDGLDEIRRRQKDSEMDFKLTAWRQDYNIEIEDPDLGICIESDVIYMWGDGKGMCCPWGYTGCSMSSDKAYELWGSRDVLGKTVYIDGISYKVACVTDTVTGIIAVKKDNYEREVKFVSLDMDPESAGDEAGIQLEEFILQNSHAADSLINYSDLVSVAGNFPILPAFFVSALMCGRILCMLCPAVKYKKGYKTTAVYVFLLVLWLCLCSFSGCFSFEIPESLIPTKWSDFDFWSGLAERYRDDLNGLRLTRKYAFDSYFVKSFMYIAARGLLSSFCLAAALSIIRNKSLCRLMAVETASAFILFYAVWASGAQYGRYSAIYWLILPMYFAFDCFINNFNVSERT